MTVYDVTFDVFAGGIGFDANKTAVYNRTTSDSISSGFTATNLREHTKTFSLSISSNLVVTRALTSARTFSISVSHSFLMFAPPSVYVTTDQANNYQEILAAVTNALYQIGRGDLAAAYIIAYNAASAAAGENESSVARRIAITGNYVRFSNRTFTRNFSLRVDHSWTPTAQAVIYSRVPSTAVTIFSPANSGVEPAWSNPTNVLTQALTPFATCACAVASNGPLYASQALRVSGIYTGPNGGTIVSISLLFRAKVDTGTAVLEIKAFNEALTHQFEASDVYANKPTASLTTTLTMFIVGGVYGPDTVLGGGSWTTEDVATMMIDFYVQKVGSTQTISIVDASVEVIYQI
jgi:hypothetical protein